jgi:predicted kinase
MPKTKAKQSPKTPPSPTAHFLIGIPGSGKSSFAKLLSQQGNSEIISTDNIRTELYGDANIQGDWSQIETTAIQHIYNAFITGKNIIYDATNFKRTHRLDFLQKVQQKFQPQQSNHNNYPLWVAWYLNTPIETCMTWNQMRSRQVPEGVITSMHQALQNFPPILAEGFILLNKIDVSCKSWENHAVAEIEKYDEKRDRSIINTQNRYSNITIHPYSNFLDFERLLHLLALILKYPGIGNLQNTNPELIAKIFKCHPNFNSDIQEISAIIAKEKGNIYACKISLQKDLQYLAQVGVISQYSNSETLTNSQNFDSELISTNEQEPQNQFTSTNINFHAYSDNIAFDRLMGTIKLIVNQPFLNNHYDNHQLTLAKALEAAGVIYSAVNELDTIRKDIEKILKPYQILPQFPMRNGYFTGTGVLSQQELIQILDVLQSHAKSLENPLTIDLYNTCKQRMLQSKFIHPNENIYPIHSITNHSIVDDKYLHETSLLKQLTYLEQAIIKGELLELNRFRSSAKYPGDANSFIQVYPLQIVFHNLAWYLGYECVSGEEEPDLLRFERLDRLFLGNSKHQFRSRSQQEKALDKLNKLIKISAGIFLGNSVADQNKYLSSNRKTYSQVCVTVELWFNDATYNFITEGTKRFTHIKMSRPKFSGKTNLPKSIFCYEQTDDKDFPNRFQVTLAKWSLQDFDLWRWIIGFGGNVKVINPPELVEKIKKMGEEIFNNYQD